MQQPRIIYPFNGTERITVCGAGGFIGGHLVAALRQRGFAHLKAVDCKPTSEWCQCFSDLENLVVNLQGKAACYQALARTDVVFNLAADTGGVGFREHHRALGMLSVLINTHLLMAARDLGVARYFYPSSASAYHTEQPPQAGVAALKGADAYPSLAADGDGCEQLFSERMGRYFREDFRLWTRTARLHNVYGSYEVFEGRREKAPAAICRKVIEAKLSGRSEIEIWGDGEQTRSFLYIDDCLAGMEAILNSGMLEPINLGSSESVSINQLVDLVEGIAGIRLQRVYNRSAPTGVNQRKSDNTRLLQEFGWEPPTRLRDGLELTYRWIYDQVVGRYRR